MFVSQLVRKFLYVRGDSRGGWVGACCHVQGSRSQQVLVMEQKMFHELKVHDSDFCIFAHNLKRDAILIHIFLFIINLELWPVLELLKIFFCFLLVSRTISQRKTPFENYKHMALFALFYYISYDIPHSLPHCLFQLPSDTPPIR